MALPGSEEFFGSTTIGEKGQMVIPAGARKALGLKKGEKLLVFGMGDMIACAKLHQVKQFATHLAKKTSLIKKALKKIR